MLIPKLFKWRKDQKEFLESLGGNSSDHIRKALDEYILKIKNTIKATISPSKIQQKGEKNGRI